MKFSIIVAAYNVEKYIEKTIQSITNQSYKNYELIIVNDGSTDKTQEILEKYSSNKQIKIIQQKNMGISGARNSGIKQATGDYIWFIDGDDYIANNALNILQEAIINNNQTDILYFNYTEDINNKYRTKQIKTISPECLTYNPSVNFKIIKRNFYKQNSLQFNNNKFEDLEFSTMILLHNPSFSLIDNSLYYYVINNNSFMHSKQFDQRKDDMYKVLDRISKAYKNKKKQEIEYIYIYHLLYAFSLNLLSYKKEIYKSRIIKNIKILKEKYPNWKNNKYYKKLSKKEKLIINLIQCRQFYILKILLKINSIIKENKT